MKQGWHLEMELETQILDRAIGYYCEAGYEYVDVPTFVPFRVINATIPEEFRRSNDNQFIGSAEQGFLALEGLPHGRYQSTTLCYRPGDAGRSEIYREVFAKNELHVICDSMGEAKLQLECMLDIVHGFFKGVGLRVVRVAFRDGSFDYEAQGIEVGSYGIRRNPFTENLYVYGTGVAEPRFSIAKALQEKKSVLSPVDEVSPLREHGPSLGE